MSELARWIKRQSGEFLHLILRRKMFVEIVFQPALIKRFFMKAQEIEEVLLPWKARIMIKPNEYIGQKIWRFGIYDLVVAEAICRLLDDGECAVDVGANIGQMTSLMAKVSGKKGKVFAFEPHPKVYESLIHNIGYWNCNPLFSSIDAEECALSNCGGEGILQVPNDFEKNMGTASLQTLNSVVLHNGIPVRIRRLDNALGINKQIGLLKLDVEGHETQVLEGASMLINEGKIRDIIFEQHTDASQPAGVADFLQRLGYSLFYIDKGLHGLTVCKLCDAEEKYRNYSYYNCLATAEPKRALRRLRKRGWAVFGLA